MKSSILSLTEIPVLPTLAFMIFVTIFLVALYRVLSPGARRRYEPLRHMPLDDVHPVTVMEKSS